MKKRILALVITLCMLLSFAASAETGGNGTLGLTGFTTFFNPYFQGTMIG